MKSNSLNTTPLRNYKTLLTALAIAFMLIGCVDKDYNLNKISSDVTIGIDGITVPIINTKRITVDSLLQNSFSEMYVNKQGYYSIMLGDTTSYTTESLIANAAIPFQMNFEPIVITHNPDESSVAFNASTSTAVEMAIPKEVKSLENVTLCNSTGNSPIVYFTLGIEGAPAGNYTVTNIIITLPDCMEYEPIEGYPVAQNNTITIDKVDLDKSDINKTVAKVRVKKIKNLNIDNQKLNAQAAFAIEGRFVPANNAPYESFTITPKINIEKAQPAVARGEFKLSLDSYLPTTTINISYLTQLMKDYTSSLITKGSVIKAEIDNPLGMDIDCQVNIVATDTAGTWLKSIRLNDLRIKAANGSKPTTTKLLVAESEEYAQQGYTTIVAESIWQLFKYLPSKIAISFTPKAVEDTTQEIVLNNPLKAEVRYTADVPLCFAKESSFVYNDKTKNLGIADKLEKASKLSVSTSQIDLEGLIASTLPVDINFGIMFLDSKGEAIDGVTIESPDTIRGTDSKSEKITPVAISVKLKDGDLRNIRQIHGMLFKTSCVASGDGVILSPDQYVQVKLWVKGHGIDLNIDSLRNTDWKSLFKTDTKDE